MSTERTSPEIVQQFHDQMRLAIGGAARHGGADAGRDGGIEEVDVEGKMQHAVLRPHALDDAADQHADAELVDRAHVGNRHAALVHQLLFQGIDRADAEQVELIGRDRRARLIAEQMHRGPASPHRNAADMPCMLPVSVVSGVL